MERYAFDSLCHLAQTGICWTNQFYDFTPKQIQLVNSGRTTRLSQNAADSPYSFLWYQTQAELRQLMRALHHVSHMREVFNQRASVRLVKLSSSDHFPSRLSEHCQVSRTSLEAQCQVPQRSVLSERFTHWHGIKHAHKTTLCFQCTCVAWQFCVACGVAHEPDF